MVCGRGAPVEAAMASRKVVWVVVILVILIGIGAILVNECSYFGGMGASMTACTCSGRELLLYDRTANDGPRKTICLGIVRSVDCYQGPGGPRIVCLDP